MTYRGRNVTSWGINVTFGGINVTSWGRCFSRQFEAVFGLFSGPEHSLL